MRLSLPRWLTGRLLLQEPEQCHYLLGGVTWPPVERDACASTLLSHRSLGKSARGGLGQETAFSVLRALNHQKGLLIPSSLYIPRGGVKNILLNAEVWACFLSALRLSLCPFIHHLSISSCTAQHPKYYSCLESTRGVIPGYETNGCWDTLRSVEIQE